MKLLPMLLFTFSLLVLGGCNSGADTNDQTSEESEPALTDGGLNTLTAAEKAAGWQLLFDGKSMTGWHNYLADTVGAGWGIEDGAMVLNPDQKGGDILTDRTFENYELNIEWKISECGNSGIIYNVHEDPEYERPWNTGPEMQVLDNTCHPDAKIEKHRAGDLYDLIACSEETVLPAGEWNKVRLIVNQGKVEQWLNGKMVVSFEMFTDEWNAMIAKSKFAPYKGFGQYKEGRICLQDHSDKVWFRNIKIKTL